MFKDELSNKSKVILFTLLVILNFVLRIPSVLHERGSDSFFIHSVANSITLNGYSELWANWLSIFGMYPYSYASSIPFSLSGMAQLMGTSGLNMEKTILLFSLIIGLFSIFGTYVLAGVVYDNFLFKYFLSFFYSISQGIMTFSTWEISARGPFMIFLPLFIFLLLKRMHYAKTLCLLIIMGLFLAATHHFFYFLFLLTILYIALKMALKIKSNFDIQYINYVYIVGLIIAFMVPFFTKSMIEAGSRYGWIIDVLIINARYSGPILIFFIGGISYLLLKSNKKFEEWYFLTIMIIFIPISYSQTYGAYIILMFVIFFITVAFKNLLFSFNAKHNVISILFVIIILFSFVTFSAYYNHVRTGDSKNIWYMSESTYRAGVWANEYVPENSIAIGGGLRNLRMITTSVHLSGPKANLSEIEVIKIDSMSSRYYFDGPYVLKPATSVSGSIEWLQGLNSIDDERGQGLVKKYRIKYFLDDSYYRTNVVPSIRATRIKIYDRSDLAIWLV